MALQQLDLFGNFSPEPDPVKEKIKKVEKPVFVPAMLELFPSEPAPEPAPITVITEEKEIQESVVFNDGKIKIRIKPKPVAKETLPVVAETPPPAPVSKKEEEVAETPKEPEQVPEEIKEPTPEKPAAVPLQLELKGYIPEPITDRESPAKKGRGRRSYKEIDATADLIDIPDDETLSQKLYYSIGEVAAWFKVNTSQIRFWENEFDILKPRKNRKGDRLFRVEDIKNLQVIYYLLRNRKFSIEGAREYLKANKHKTNVDIQLVQSLTLFRSFLLELKASLGE